MGLISQLFSATWILLFSFQFAFTFGLPQLSTVDLDPIQQETCPTTNEELVSTLNGQLQCCKKCPAGEGMLQICTNTTQTVCRPCQEGSEFALEASATAKCMQCKQCQELHPFAKFRKHCTPTSDAVCECVAGYFFIEVHSTCQSCTKCPPGYGAEKPCDWNEDSICNPCPEGTWSSTESATQKCLTCKKCKPGQIEMRPCTATQNTLCCPLHNPNCDENYEEDEFDEMPPATDPHQRQELGYFQMQVEINSSESTKAPTSNWVSFSETGINHDLSRTLNSMKIQTAFRVDDSKSLPGVGHLPENSFPPQFTYGDDYPMITIYCSLLGLVILTLLIYVFYKLWQQKLSIEDAKSIEAGIFHPAFTGIKASGGKSKSSKLAVSAKDTNDRQHLLGESQQCSYDPQKSVIPDQLLMELSQGLAVDNRWKHVGAKLGFNEESLQNFEKPKISEDSEDVISIVKHMLTSWYSSRIYTDPSPLNSLLVVLDSAPGTSKLARHLKEYLKSSCAINSSTNSSPSSNNQ